MFARRPERWATRFGGFVLRYTALALASELGCTDKAVYRWISGATVPGLHTAVVIERISSGAVTVQDIEAHAREVRNGDGAGAGARAMARRAAQRYRR